MRASQIRPEIHQILSTAANSAGWSGSSRATRAVDEAADAVVGLLVQSELVEADPEPEVNVGGENGLAAQVQALTATVQGLVEFARQRAGYSG